MSHQLAATTSWEYFETPESSSGATRKTLTSWKSVSDLAHLSSWGPEVDTDSLPEEEPAEALDERAEKQSSPSQSKLRQSLRKAKTLVRETWLSKSKKQRMNAYLEEESQMIMPLLPKQAPLPPPEILVTKTTEQTVEYDQALDLQLSQPLAYDDRWAVGEEEEEALKEPKPTPWKPGHRRQQSVRAVPEMKLPQTPKVFSMGRRILLPKQKPSLCKIHELKPLVIPQMPETRPSQPQIWQQPQSQLGITTTVQGPQAKMEPNLQEHPGPLTSHPVRLAKRQAQQHPAEPGPATNLQPPPLRPPNGV
jgi:hypothetical protein